MHHSQWISPDPGASTHTVQIPRSTAAFGSFVLCILTYTAPQLIHFDTALTTAPSPEYLDSNVGLLDPEPFVVEGGRGRCSWPRPAAWWGWRRPRPVSSARCWPRRYDSGHRHRRRCLAPERRGAGLSAGPVRPVFRPAGWPRPLDSSPAHHQQRSVWIRACMHWGLTDRYRQAPFQKLAS